MNSLARRDSREGQRSLMRPWFQEFFDIENFFGKDFFPALSSRSSLPAVNIIEDEEGFTIEVAAPGYKKEDFQVNIENNILSISAETKQDSSEGQDKNKQYSRREYNYSSFTRSFQLPENVKEEEISALYADGILKLQIPKVEQQAKTSKQIEIK